MRFAACVEYNGSGFSGWQAQKFDVRTVQEEVEKALSKVADEDIKIVTAGRTDTGVHATHQVIHFDSDSQRTLDAWVLGTNRFMPMDVRIIWVVPVSEQFHARFSAVSRSYRYIIYNRNVASAIHQRTTSVEFRTLDIEKMASASKHLEGTHDYSSFRASGCQASSPVRTIESVNLDSSNEYLWLDITANAFLQHMVRNIIGALVEIGYGKRNLDWIKYLLEVKDRTKGSITAEPYGLYLCGVEYPNEFDLPSTYQPVSYWG